MVLDGARVQGAVSGARKGTPVRSRTDKWDEYWPKECSSKLECTVAGITWEGFEAILYGHFRMGRAQSHLAKCRELAPEPEPEPEPQPQPQPEHIVLQDLSIAEVDRSVEVAQLASAESS